MSYAVSVTGDAPDGKNIVEIGLELQLQAHVHGELIMVYDRYAFLDEARYDPVSADSDGVLAYRAIRSCP